jgi:hypothetical protein
MRTVRWLVAAGLLASATGCIEVNGLPNTSMGGYPSSGYYGSNAGSYGQPALGSSAGLLNSLFSQPSYYPQAYQPAPQYIPVPVASPQPQPQYSQPQSGRPQWARRDRNNNGVPDWKERDRNGDGIPDYQQRRNRSG